MLTKEHLKFRVRTGRIKPEFLAGDANVLAQAGAMIDVVRAGVGMQLGELEEALDAVGSGDVGAAFEKLLLDGCAADDDDGSVYEARWQALLKSQALRQQGAGLSVDAFHAAMGGDLSEKLYSDLPACRRVSAFKDTTPEALVHRYNCAQVQGLLLRARSVVVTLKSADVAERRALFKQLRFHRLMGEVSEAKGKLRVALTGPLGIFDQAATYGMRLANFFPHVLHLSSWEIEAEVHIKSKNLTLKLDDSCGLKSHYRHHVPFIPDELLAFVDAFNARYKPWRAEAGADFVHIGRESYCFPDLTITSHDGRKTHVELFHRWHAGPLAHRLQALEKNAVSNLCLGVAKNLAKTPEVAAALAASEWFAKRGFLFSEFPTPKTLAGRVGAETEPAS